MVSCTCEVGAASSRPISVQYKTVSASAKAPADFLATSGTLTIPAWHRGGTVSVDVRGDRDREGSESFFLELHDPMNATVARARARCTIVDDD